MFCPVCGEQTKILQTRLLADGSKKRISRGIFVFFIQNESICASGKTKSIPVPFSSDSRFIRPFVRSFGLSATSTLRETVLEPSNDERVRSDVPQALSIKAQRRGTKRRESFFIGEVKKGVNCGVSMRMMSTSKRLDGLLPIR